MAELIPNDGRGRSGDPTIPRDGGIHSRHIRGVREPEQVGIVRTRALIAAVAGQSIGGVDDEVVQGALNVVAMSDAYNRNLIVVLRSNRRSWEADTSRAMLEPED